MTPAPIYLHIGAMKTGTTYLQQLMFANQERLAAAGYRLTGGRWARQVRGVNDALGVTRDDDRVGAESAGAWQVLVDDALSHSGTASVLSMEFLSFARRGQVQRIVASLAPAEVHVVLTVRDAVATIPAQWQTNVRNGSTVAWPEHQRSVRKITTVRGRLGGLSPDRALRSFHRAQGVPRMLDRWGPTVRPGRLHVITVPPPGSDPRLLWDRFAGVVGIDPATCADPPERDNPSLGHASAELLRRVNLSLGRLPRADYTPTINQYLATEVLAGRDEPRAELDPATRRFAMTWNGRVRDAVTTSGARLCGDLDDLPVDVSSHESIARPGGTVLPSEPLVLAAAASALEGLHGLARQRARRLRRNGVAAQPPSGVDAAAAAHGWAAATEPVDAAASEVAAMALAAIELHRQLRQLPGRS